VEAFDLAVGAGPVGLGRDVPDPFAGEQLAEGPVLDVAEAVVGHQPFDGDPVRGVEGEGVLEKPATVAAFSSLWSST
jgi:hypothetical protein